MSIQSLKAFWERASYDPALQARLRTIKGDSAARAIAEVVDIAREFGYEFTAEEYKVGLPAVARPASPPPAILPPREEPPSPSSTSDCCGHKMDC